MGFAVEEVEAFFAVISDSEDQYPSFPKTSFDMNANILQKTSDFINKVYTGKSDNLTDTWFLSRRINELNLKYYLICRSVELFNNNYFDISRGKNALKPKTSVTCISKPSNRIYYISPTGEKTEEKSIEAAFAKSKSDEEKFRSYRMNLNLQAKQSLLDCYLHFENFLYLSKSFLDLLAKLYPRFIKHDQSMAQRSFNSLRIWICQKASSQGFHQDVIKFFKDETGWFDVLKEIRDMLAHNQGYFPLIGRRPDGLISLDICTVKA